MALEEDLTWSSQQFQQLRPVLQNSEDIQISNLFVNHMLEEHAGL